MWTFCIHSFISYIMCLNTLILFFLIILGFRCVYIFQVVYILLIDYVKFVAIIINILLMIDYYYNIFEKAYDVRLIRSTLSVYWERLCLLMQRMMKGGQKCERCWPETGIETKKCVYRNKVMQTHQCSLLSHSRQNERTQWLLMLLYIGE